MVQGCRIDTGSCKKPLSKKDSPKTLGTRLSCKTGTGLSGQRARQAFFFFFFFLPIIYAINQTQSEAYMRLGNKDDQSVQVQVVNCQRLVDYS